MFTNYFKIVLRNFIRHPGYNIINIMGLAIGLTTSILIALWVINELQVDTSHGDHERIYQVLYNTTFADGHIETSEGTAGPLAEAIMAEIPEVEAAGRWDDPTQRLLRYEKKSLLQNGLWTDPGILTVFSVKVLR